MNNSVQNKSALIHELLHNREKIRSFGVKTMGLFGSFVHNTHSENSDVDLLVDFEQDKKTFDNFMDLSFYLESLLGRKIELVTPQSLSSHIGPHILKQVENVSI